jgi:hypothetical protein
VSEVLVQLTAPEQAASSAPIVFGARFLTDLAELPGYAGHDFRSSSGSLAMFAAMRRASSRVSNLASDWQI